ncbi:PilC/PilY family type IV pilus protein [Eikenella sp. NML03-A-027]|uniref:PilC/PilY family type IV pilus protein n=1 Tax=Eikenella sp. NML03-A-027 TaxID=1795828 RepID=UPI0009EDD935|nr:PilC/PilY family type IV pilus protein [Eikenella sp. NML03-A-027]
MKTTTRKQQANVGKRITPTYQALVAALMAVYIPQVHGDTPFNGVIEENFSGGTTTNKWLMPLPGDGFKNPWDPSSPSPTVINSACLTAGTQSSKPTATVAGSPPRCTGVQDNLGKGVLRLTPAQNQVVGGIVSDFTFGTQEGVEITFITYTWGGSGADGMTFFLADGSKPATLGASGGSIGYSCTNENPIFSGVYGGYMGIGIDEWGNFVYKHDNTTTGAPGLSQRLPNTIGIRGAGSINHTYISKHLLQEIYTKFGWGTVPASVQNNWTNLWTSKAGFGQWAINAPSYRRFVNVCKTGQLTIDSAYLPSGQGALVLSDKATDPRLKLYNYQYFAHKQLPRRFATESARSRDQAVPMLYKIRITPNGKASVWISYNGGDFQPVMTDFDIVAANGPLPKSFRFGFMGATGGAHNNHEVLCFKATPATQSEGSADVNLPDAKLASDSQVYLSFFNKVHWYGNLTAQNILRKPNGTYAVQPGANWDAACVLTGGPCERKGNRIVNKQPVRKFFTWTGTAGAALEWSNISPSQQAALSSPGEPAGMGEARLAYLKGDTSREVGQPNGVFRPRKKLLGDIINSSPVWLGYPNNKNYLSAPRWRDSRYLGAAMQENNGQPYTTFANSNRTRTNIVYAGSNDGFLHAFRSGSYNAAGQFQTANNDGQEMFAYIPGAVLSRIHNKTNAGLDLFSPQYAHNYYNDAPVGTGDVFYGGSWHTWVMGGLGAGGDTIYALDVTNPDSFNASNVIGEWSRSSGGEWNNLGNTYGTPVFGRFHDGNWGAVFGNGWCSTTDAANGNCTASNGPAGIYVMSINQSTGKPSFKFISTGEAGTPDAPNGIAYVTPVDLDGDNIYDYAYAGDIKGNVWRFNLLSQNSNDWTVQPQKLFTAPPVQPISTKIIVTRMGRNGASGDVILNFGTGMRKEGYLGTKTTYATGQQSIYGIRDKTALAFNPAAGTTVAQVNHSQMQAQVIHEGGKKDQLSNMNVDWNTKSGWYLNLTRVTINGKVEYEQVIYNPYLERGKYLIVNTFIDGSNPALSCNVIQSSGYTYPLNAVTGSGLRGFFDGNFNGSSYRKQLNAVGSPLLLKTTDGKLLLLTKDSQGNVNLHEVYLPETPSIRRISWREIF